MSENCQTSAGETQQGTSCAPLAGDEFAAFVDTIAALRAPGGCPWDREQTHESITGCLRDERRTRLLMLSSSTMLRIFVKSWAMFFCRWFCKARLLPMRVSSRWPTYAMM